MTCVISFVGLLSQSFSASLSANKRPYRSDLAESLSFKLSLVMPAIFVLLSLLMVRGGGVDGDGGVGGGLFYFSLLLFVVVVCFCFSFIMYAHV